MRQSRREGGKQQAGEVFARGERAGGRRQKAAGGRQGSSRQGGKWGEGREAAAGGHHPPPKRSGIKERVDGRQKGGRKEKVEERAARGGVGWGETGE